MSCHVMPYGAKRVEKKTETKVNGIKGKRFLDPIHSSIPNRSKMLSDLLSRVQGPIINRISD